MESKLIASFVGVVLVVFSVASLASSCADLDRLNLTSEPLLVLENAMNLSKELLISDQVDKFYKKLDGYLKSQKRPVRRDMNNPFCKQIADVMNAADDNPKNEWLANIRDRWIGDYRGRLQLMIEKMPVAPVSGCDHITIPMTNAFADKLRGDIKTFRTIKSQYDECLLVMQKRNGQVPNPDVAQVNQRRNDADNVPATYDELKQENEMLKKRLNACGQKKSTGKQGAPPVPDNEKKPYGLTM